ncbi:hypothetical protein BFP72_18145 [Reichenbachiella sp. 5M10]|nr:hypothetical protein BFP72_18145 [Reichenbachiella sp. 5M10]
MEGHCQLKKFYTVKNNVSYDTVDFSMKATSGTCFVKPSHHHDPLTIYGNPSFSEVNPTFNTTVRQSTNYVTLELEDYNKKGLSHAITYNVFGNDDNREEKDFWKVYLTDQKIYNLKLTYGVGDSYINLSDVAVANFKIESGSADVNIKYDEGKRNRCLMDTFSVAVDLGTLVAQKMHLAQAKNVIAEVGFGTAVLDFGKGMTQKCKVNASVGAGTLKILIPESEFPAIIHFKSSPLCKYSLEQGFEQIEKDVYVNKAYSADADNLMEFVIDVALGNITFEYIK